MRSGVRRSPHSSLPAQAPSETSHWGHTRRLLTTALVALGAPGSSEIPLTMNFNKRSHWDVSNLKALQKHFPNLPGDENHLGHLTKIKIPRPLPRPTESAFPRGGTVEAEFWTSALGNSHHQQSGKTVLEDSEGETWFVTPGNFLCHVRGHTLAWEAQVLRLPAELHPQQWPTLVSSFQGLNKDTDSHHEITYILHCSWGKTFWMAKQNCCSDTFLIGKLEVIGFKAIRCCSWTGGWEPCHLSPWLTMQWRKPVTKHKNSLELPGTATYSRTGVPGGWPPLMVWGQIQVTEGDGRPETAGEGRGFQRRSAGTCQSSGGLTPGRPPPAPCQSTETCYVPTGRWRWHTPPPAYPSTSGARGTARNPQRSPGGPRAEAAQTWRSPVSLKEILEWLEGFHAPRGHQLH